MTSATVVTTVSSPTVGVYGGDDLIVSAYPLTQRIVSQIVDAKGIDGAPTLCLGELKRASLSEILASLRAIRVKRLWIALSDHNYQPYRPLMLLIAACTRAREIHVVDFFGDGYRVFRPQILVREPLRLLVGSWHGFAAMRRARSECENLLAVRRIGQRAIPARAGVAYLKTNLWFGVQAGGSVGHVAGVVNGLARNGCDVTAYTADHLPGVDRSVAVMKVIGEGVGGLPLENNSYLFHQLFTQQLRTALAAKRADFIYQRYCLCNFAGVVLSRELGLPLVIEYNGSEVWASQHWGTPLRNHATALAVENVNLHHAHLIVVVSDVLKDELVSRGIGAERILSYPNCIDPLVFDPGRYSREQSAALRARLGIGSDQVVFTFLGTFGRWHGVDVLARAVAHLATTELSWLRAQKVHFLLVGDGQLMPQVRDILVGVPADIVTFAGLVPQEEAPAYLAASDVLLSPHVPNPDGTRFFGSPTKLFEYMGMRKAIIASELEQIGAVLAGSWHVGRLGLPVSDEALIGSRSLLTTPGSEEQLVAAVRFLARQPTARARLGEAARDFVVGNFTWDRQVRVMLDRLHTMSRKETVQ